MLCVLLFLAHAVYFSSFFFFFFNDTATTEIYTLSLHDALPILGVLVERRGLAEFAGVVADLRLHEEARSEHGAPLQRLVVGDRKSTRLNSSHLVISYAVFCLKKKKITEIHIIVGSMRVVALSVQ